MKKNFTLVCGIDVSKDQLDSQLLVKSTGQSLNQNRFSNDLVSINRWLDSQSEESTLYVVEATGSYSAKLLYALDQRGLSVAVVSPLQSKSFMSALGISNKHDRQAADSLAQMGQRLSLKLYQMPSEEMKQRKQLNSALRALNKQHRMLTNQLHSLDQEVIIQPDVKKAYQSMAQAVEQQIQKLEKALAELDDDEAFQQASQWAGSVIGIGTKTAQAILLAAGCLGEFQHAGQLSKFFGLTPQSHYSGTSVYKKGRITKFGNHYVRSLLYMCTRSAIRFNPPCRDLYQRLRAKGKPHKVAAVAVMHKLIKQVFVCVKKQVNFDPHYQQNTQLA